jgi:hypothetical protein
MVEENIVITVEDNWLVMTGESEYKPKRKCGYIQDECYIREVNPESHFYVLGSGYPISNAILKWLKEHNIDCIILIEKGKRATTWYRTTVQAYLDNVLIKHGSLEYQRCLPLNQMKKEKVIVNQ